MIEQQPHQKLSQPQDGGYTIIESLVAMIVVSVLMIAIAPVMAFSVATRVQARRTELATQAARAYIDALRTGAIPQTSSDFPAKAQSPNAADIEPAPSNPNRLYCADLDGQAGCSGSKDFRIQGAWRNPANSSNDPTPTGYELIVRVYRADASAGVMKTEQQSVANSGIGDPNAPLTVMRTQIPPTTAGGASAYQSLCDRTTTGGTAIPSNCKVN
jgi:prepilin-type N-terminal cleavage/methylation domain-containing protein